MDNWKYDPARDHDLESASRRQSPQREPSLVSALISLLWWLLVRAYLKTFHRLRILGRANLPTDPGFIIVANHASHLDALTLAASLPLRWNGHVYPVAAGDTFFEKPSATYFATLCLNALPLWRRKASGHALTELRNRLSQNNQVLVIFPEGTRSRDGSLQSFKPGIGHLLASTSTLVIPAHIHGAHAAFPPKARTPRPKAISVTFGPALSFPDTSDDRDGWRSIASALESAVRDLSKA